MGCADWRLRGVVIRFHHHTIVEWMQNWMKTSFDLAEAYWNVVIEAKAEAGLCLTRPSWSGYIFWVWYRRTFSSLMAWACCETWIMKKWFSEHEIMITVTHGLATTVHIVIPLRNFGMCWSRLFHGLPNVITNRSHDLAIRQSKLKAVQQNFRICDFLFGPGSLFQSLRCHPWVMPALSTVLCIPLKPPQS